MVDGLRIMNVCSMAFTLSLVNSLLQCIKDTFFFSVFGQLFVLKILNSRNDDRFCCCSVLMFKAISNNMFYNILYEYALRIC